MLDITQTETSPEKRKQSRDWYHEHKEDYNATRRERYAENKGAREKARKRAAKYRKSNPLVTRRLTRVVGTKTINVFSTGQIAQGIGRTPQTIRNWEANGLIPASTFPDKQRLYTSKQVDLIFLLASVIDDNDGAWTGTAVDKAVSKLHKKW